MTLLTPVDLQAFLTQRNITARLIAGAGDTPTVPAAAAALGVESEQIIKTLLFLVEHPDSAQPLPVVVISCGETRVDKKRLAEHYGIGKKRITLAPADVVADQLGFPAGGVPPFGHRTQLPVLLDAAVLTAAQRHAGVIYGGGGDDRTMMELTVTELMAVVEPMVVAVSG